MQGKTENILFPFDQINVLREKLGIWKINMQEWNMDVSKVAAIRTKASHQSRATILKQSTVK
jgi:hypothetical protein